MSATQLPQAQLASGGKLRDPDFSSRVFWLVLAILLLWPLGVATEFRPWVLWEPDNRKVTLDFLASFWPLVHEAEFMRMVARVTRVAIGPRALHHKIVTHQRSTKWAVGVC